MEMIKDSLTMLLITTIIGGLSLVSAQVTFFIKRKKAEITKKTELLEDERKRALINNALNRLDDVITKNVIAANETVVKEIKEKAQDKRLTKTELKAVSLNVRDSIKNQLSKDIKNTLSLEIEDLNGYIKAEIEEKLNQLKKENSLNLADNTLETT